MKKLIVFTALIVALATTALAADNLNRCFYSMDRNGDEFVTKDEFKAALPNSDAAYTEADTDKSGKLDHEEWEAFKKSKGIEENHG